MAKAPAFLAVFPVLAAMASTAMATAVQQPVNDADAITIIGKSPPQLREEVTAYIRQLGVVLGERPAGRWVDPVCPRAIGLEESQASKVESRIREVASSVGAPGAPPKCSGNLVVAFTNDAPALVQQISKRNTIGDLSFEERKALETGSSPIRWWYSNEIRGEDNAPTQGGVAPPALLNGIQSSLGGSTPNATNGALPTTDRTGFSNSRTASLITTSGHRAIRHATIVVDARHVAGRSLDSLIDFAALVGLAEIKLGASHPGSILNLFAAENVDRMTTNDLALLRGLYSLHLKRKADQHRRVLIGTILKDRLSPGKSRVEQ